MFKAFVLAAFAAAAVNAASWPMITVNSAGDIVLNAPTRASSLQFTAAAVTAAPTGSTAGTRSTVSDLGDTTNGDSDVFELTVPSGLATSGGIKLPAATVGRTITIFNAASTATSYTLWSSSTSVFIDGSTLTSVTIDASAAWVQAIAVSTTRWILRTSASSANNSKGFVATNTITTTSSATTSTLTTAQMLNGVVTGSIVGAAATFTTATAAELTAADANSANGDSYTFTLKNTGTQAYGTDLSLTLAAGSGVTVPSDGTQLVVPGQTRIYSLYRTSSSAWTIVQTSSFIIYPTSTISPSAIVSISVPATTSLTRTVHATRWNADIDCAASESFSIRFVNNYAGLRDIVVGGNVDNAAKVAGNGKVGVLACAMRAANTINCKGEVRTTGSSKHVLNLIKA